MPAFISTGTIQTTFSTFWPSTWTGCSLGRWQTKSVRFFHLKLKSRLSWLLHVRCQLLWGKLEFCCQPICAFATAGVDKTRPRFVMSGQTRAFGGTLLRFCDVGIRLSAVNEAAVSFKVEKIALELFKERKTRLWHAVAVEGFEILFLSIEGQSKFCRHLGWNSTEIVARTAFAYIWNKILFCKLVDKFRIDCLNYNLFQ